MLFRSLPFPLINLLGRHGQWVVDRGNGLLACVVSGHGDWEALPDDELAATLAGELDQGEAAVWHKVIREKRATFSARPGILRPAWKTSHPRIFLAGDYIDSPYPATIEAAVRSGIGTARSILKRSNEINQMMKVIGEEGTSAEDYILYQKGELLDAVYLQQNSFDPIDAACDPDRQIHEFNVLYDVLTRDAPSSGVQVRVDPV